MAPPSNNAQPMAIEREVVLVTDEIAIVAMIVAAANITQIGTGMPRSAPRFAISRNRNGPGGSVGPRSNRLTARLLVS